MNIVLVEPEIPQNTGNIARTCAATGAKLHLIKPLGFVLDDKHLKRAGLDYWNLMEYTVYENMQDFLERNPGANMYFLSTKAPRDYTKASYRRDDYLVFGKETKGLDEQLLCDNYNRCLRIPMREEARSLNLSNSVAIVLYEALRQLSFEGLADKGQLHHLPTPPEKEWADYV
ncbi:MAG: tRNA (uridine(34)/cytosine(34)/5-carboxymethylaminomethyluridine(34)-2'-O)-methyltransferase TrmL [Clostridia bacterium]|nr:tRNA (uridine(34)/cytosine(34)/5-carboxymethylaminomethyluridine(34)-2'-O)-methyltransferase TrmL [Clostridia bacterium]